ncbi:hypothetical protein [Acinetobacter sp. HY1485]|uniref:hypothetical protein n=1 Tax=Acinetobacter sp. HY1485 TaxID=2970918 RepID=UPI0022B9C7E9|nr:hypothetical protein [Acinetobacter sp. HY1485]
MDILTFDPLATIKSLVYGHLDFINRNTGTTKNAQIEHFLLNEDRVLSNNRHFIAETMAEYQPNGDGTTEGQSLHIIGNALMYLATKDQQFLDHSVKAWEAYIQYYYAGQPIPNTPQRYICNWLVNSKEPVLANYPINPKEPTQGGFKCVPLVFKNGQAKIPHGAPYWGEYLDSATYAHRGHMTWDSINASVQKIQENVDGKIDWQDIYDNYRTTEQTEPWSSLAWIDWPRYLGQPSYKVQWGGASSKDSTFGVSWINVRTKNRIGMGKGPNDQLWSGDIIATNIPDADIGIVQLEDTSINGVYLFNYATKNPVDKGGYQFSRNEPWHNRPVHTPFLGSKNQLGNAADAEVWFIDACYLLWRITGEDRFKKALDCCFYTAHEYTYIDAADKFFRQSTVANTPFTDAISYDFSYPELTEISYSRDAKGYIQIVSKSASQHFMEQQSVWYRINKNSKLRVTVGGLTDTGQPLVVKAMLDINQVKAENDSPNWWGVSLPQSTSMEPITRDVELGHLAQLTNPKTNDDYLIADARAVTDYGNCSFVEAFEDNIYDGRASNVVRSTFVDDDGGLIIGFWLTTTKKVLPESIVYRADADFNLRITDNDGWNWWWMIPKTGTDWGRVFFDKTKATLSSYQPNHKDATTKPTSPNYAEQTQIQIIQDGSVANAHFDYYCINDVPPLFKEDDGWTLTFRVAFKGDDSWKATLGDCQIMDYRLDSLAYCPGVIPFSNIYAEGTDQIGAWHGMPYPGYQYPMMYTIHQDKSKYQTWLNNQIEFLYDSQVAYKEKVGISGPGCAAYVWNRWDNFKYGTADTWTNNHWGDGKPWSGYQPRAFNAAARTWYELAMRGEQIPIKLQVYVENWIKYLVKFSAEFGRHTPNDFPVSDKPTWIEDDWTGHMIGLWLAGCCYAQLAGSTVDGLREVIDTAVKELIESFTITDVPDHNINGSWSPAPRESSDNGMYFGFYTGEILRGLALYMMCRQGGSGFDMYQACAISDHKVASLTQ